MIRQTYDPPVGVRPRAVIRLARVGDVYYSTVPLGEKGSELEAADEWSKAIQSLPMKYEVCLVWNHMNVHSCLSLCLICRTPFTPNPGPLLLYRSLWILAEIFLFDWKSVSSQRSLVFANCTGCPGKQQEQDWNTFSL